MRIGITLGDPTGIGPEIVCATLAGATAQMIEGPPALDAGVEIVVFGDRGVLDAAARLIGVAPPSRVEAVTALPAWNPGHQSQESGRAQLLYLEAAIAEAQAGRLDALVTAPIHKASCLAAGFAFPGHTELLAARLVGGAQVTMMFAGPRLRVSLATIHLPLAQVPAALTIEGLATTIVHTVQALVRDFGIALPRVAVAGLNPHAGESGHFGDEESRVIAPAIAAARARLGEVGREVSGPHVPDVVFRNHADGGSDAVVALYHDQGLIPVKLIDFDEAVNVTLGLPIVRTSPDHGVAHDIAGQGRARATSLRAALALARRLASTRRPA